MYNDRYTPLYGWLLLFGLLLFGAFLLWQYDLLQQLQEVCIAEFYQLLGLLTRHRPHKRTTIMRHRQKRYRSLVGEALISNIVMPESGRYIGDNGCLAIILYANADMQQIAHLLAGAAVTDVAQRPAE